MGFYNISDREGTVTISVFFEDGESRVVAQTSPTFKPLLDHLLEHGSEDEETLRRLVDPAVFIGSEMTAVAGDRVTYDLRDLYFDGKRLNTVLAHHVKAMIDQGDQNWKGLVRFMVNLDANPSRNAQQATYAWVQRHGLTITEDGCFLGYKAVLRDHTSSSTGPDNYINGEYFGEPGVAYHVPHEVGTVVSKKRADVDDTPGGGCSVGLHVGTYDYAKDFAPVLMTVKVNPEHVVSADESSQNFKIRVCQYEVMEINENKVDFIGATTSTDLGAAPFTEIPDGNEADVESSSEAPSTPWKVVEHDGLGVTVLERFETSAAAWEAYDGYVEREPEGDFEVVEDEPEDEEHAIAGTEFLADEDETYREIPTLDEEDVVDMIVTSAALNSPSPGFTLAENAALVPELKADLEDTHLGHKPLAAKWSHLTSEASVRRYRKSHGISLSLLTKIKG